MKKIILSLLFIILTLSPELGCKTHKKETLQKQKNSSQKTKKKKALIILADDQSKNSKLQVKKLEKEVKNFKTQN